MTLAPATVAILLIHSPVMAGPMLAQSPSAEFEAQDASGQGGPPQDVPAPTVPQDKSSAAATPAPPTSPPDSPTSAHAPPVPPIATTEEPVQSDIVVHARTRSPGDPFERVNAKSFAVTQKVDDAVTGPLAMAYKHGLPKPVRSGLRNFFWNLHEPVVFVNYLLQLKPFKAAETVGRFAVNSTLGGAGLFDVAKRRPFHLPRRPNGFGDTMGYYGVKPGPYFYLPLIGPTTLRDFIGGAVDRVAVPLAIGGPFTSLAYRIPAGAVKILDRRAEFDDTLHHLREETPDPYVARRKLYLQRRQAEIDALHGRPHPAPNDGAPPWNGPAPSATALPLPDGAMSAASPPADQRVQTPSSPPQAFP